MRATRTKCCSVALIIRTGSPLHSLKPENKERNQMFPSSLVSYSWNHSGFVPETGLWSTLSKRESQWKFCLWKIISFDQDFYVSPSLSMTRKCWPQSLLHYLGFWGTRSSPWACSCLPCYSLGKEPRQIYVSFLVFKTISLKKAFHTMLFINAVSLLSYNCSSCLSWASVKSQKTLIMCPDAVIWRIRF